MGDPHVGRRLIAPALWARDVRKLDVVVLSACRFRPLQRPARAPRPLRDRRGPGRPRLRGAHQPPPPSNSSTTSGGEASPSRPSADGARIGPRRRDDPDRDPPGRDDPPRLDPTTPGAWSWRWWPRAVDGVLLTGDLERDGLADVVGRPTRPLDAMLAPHHGGRTSNPAFLYEWARPALVFVSQRPLASGTRDPLEPLALGHFPLLRTWQSGAIRLRWAPEGLLAAGFLDPAEAPAWPLPTASEAMLGLIGLAIGLAACLALTVVEWGAWSLVLPGRKLEIDPPRGPRGPTDPGSCARRDEARRDLVFDRSGPIPGAPDAPRPGRGPIGLARSGRGDARPRVGRGDPSTPRARRPERRSTRLPRGRGSRPTSWPGSRP